MCNSFEIGPPRQQVLSRKEVGVLLYELSQYSDEKEVLVRWELEEERSDSCQEISYTGQWSAAHAQLEMV